MQMLRSKAKLTAAIATILLMASVMLIANVPVKAQLAAQQPVSGPLPAGVTVNATVRTAAFLSFRPALVGVGQTILVNLWVTPAPAAGRMLLDYKITITKPDGTKEVLVMNSRWDDGTAWFEYITDQVGEWKLKFEFPGTYFPPGRYYQGYMVTNTSGTLYTGSNYYNPASTAEQTLTVQQEMVYSWPEQPLPTDYWTRPLISILNREWWPMAGNWLTTGYVGGGPVWDELYPDTNPYWSDNYRFTPWVQGPNSAHIVWKRLGAIAGWVGPSSTLNTTSSAGSPGLIYVGRCYQTVTRQATVLINGTYRIQPASVAECYDLRTGEVYYDIPIADGGVTPSIIAYSGSSAQLIAFSDNRMLKINPLTGAVTTNVTLPGSLTSAGTYYMNQYCINLQTLGTGANTTYRLINWTTAGNGAIVGNITWPWSSITADVTFDFDAGIMIRAGSVYEAAGRVGCNFAAFRVKDGAVLWNNTITEFLYNPKCNIADHGKYALLTAHGYYNVYDVYSGKFLWKSEALDYPWDEPGWGSYTGASAYGLFFRFGYSGVYAFNWTDGKRVWKYEAHTFSAFESEIITADGVEVFPFYSTGIIADGKMYITNGEHTPTTPRSRGWSLHCINITTGEGIWRITGEQSTGAIADGYLAAANSYDGYMYVYGKGKSATTVTAPDVVIPKGNGIVIKGTVLDMSPAQPGTPCVSKGSMTLQMEYLHMQRPIDGIWHNETIIGVPVILTAIGSDGTVIDLGAVTTNGYYGTFSLAWTPPDEGTYEIIASFVGDDSYGSSSAATAVSVGPAQEAYPTPIAPEAPIDNTPLLNGILAAVVVAIVVGIVAILLGLLAFRKRQ